MSRIARTHKQAVAAVKAYRPGLVLADIQMADGSSGLEAVNEFLIGFEVRLFLSLHFRNNCSRASVPSPTFLVTKPFQAVTLKGRVAMRSGPRALKL